MFERLKYFSAAEFGPFPSLVTVGLLTKVDLFRAHLGAPVYISEDPGAVIRLGLGTSQHFFGRAVDPLWPKRGGELVPLVELREAARLAGFSGFGAYEGGLLHLDIRLSRSAEDPATWGARRRGNSWEYISLAAWAANPPAGMECVV